MTIDFSIIIPIKNEAGNISFVIEDLDKTFQNSEFLVVIGDCFDDTWKIVHSIGSLVSTNTLRLINQKGLGKGGAVWTGVSESVGATILVFDGDRTIPAEDALRIAEQAKESGSIVVAERFQLRQRGAMPLANYFYNRLMAQLFTLVFRTRCSDLFAGCKAFPSSQKDRLYSLRYFFSDKDQWSDLQLLSAACELNLEIRSVPVRYKRRISGESKIIKANDGLNLLGFVLESAAKKIYLICRR